MSQLKWAVWTDSSATDSQAKRISS